MGKSSYYRADIDGLRAVAVLGVLLFHLDLDLFSGGYVGVDAFFVISGFLITRLIRDDVAAGKFSFTRFYVRRARRIFPALFLTLALTLICGYLFFSNQHLMRLGGALVSAVFSVSNFYFWSETGYFDTAADLKPLLHTWSLGIEEQFYLLWPALLVFVLVRAPRWGPVVLLVLGGAFSLMISEFFVRWPEIAFFLLPFRAFEFALGAILVWLNPCRMKSPLWGELWVGLGLALVGYAMVTFTAETPFPGLNALVPCVGTAWVIYGGQTRYLSRILSNPVAVGIGLISYSLYLVHWPLVVFYKYLIGGPIGATEAWGLGLASVALAALSYRLVERPMRYGRETADPWSPPAVGLASAVVALLIAVPSAILWQANWKDARAGIQHSMGYKRISVQVETGVPCEGMDLPPGTWCKRFGEGEKNLLIWGDSHANAFAQALQRGIFKPRDFRVTLIAHEGCPPIRGFVRDDIYTNAQNCDDRSELERVFAEVKKEKPDLFILMARWSLFVQYMVEYQQRYDASKGSGDSGAGGSNTAEDSKDFLDGMKQDLVASLKEFSAQAPVLVLREVPTTSLGSTPAAVSKGLETFSVADHRKIQEKTTALLDAVEKESKVESLDLSLAFCDETNCRIGIEGTPLFTDDNHVNNFGSLMMWARFEHAIRARMGLP